MRKKQAEKDEVLIEIFCDDWKLPIDVYNPDIFPRRLEWYSQATGIDYQKKFNDFIDGICGFASVYAYIDWRHKLKNRVVDDLTEAAKLNTFSSYGDYFSDTNHTDHPRFSFKEEDDGREFISIKFKNAALCGIFDNPTERIIDFFQKYTDNEHLISSHIFDQCCFDALGYCDARTYIVVFLEKTIDKLESLMPELVDHIFIHNCPGSEILIELGNGAVFPLKKLRDAISSIFQSAAEDVEISVFKLYKLVGIDGYIRLIDGEENKKIGFDGVDDPVINQVIHYYYNAKMEYEDLIYDSGVYGLVKMLCPIDDPIPAGIEEVDPFYPGK